MKKKITSPDGTITEIEGTAEEFAELEKKDREASRKSEGKTKGRRVLNEEKVSEMIQQALDKHEAKPHGFTYYPLVPCPYKHYPEPYEVSPWVPFWEHPRIWLTTTSDRIELHDAALGEQHTSVLTVDGNKQVDMMYQMDVKGDGDHFVGALLAGMRSGDRS